MIQSVFSDASFAYDRNSQEISSTAIEVQLLAQNNEPEMPGERMRRRYGDTRLHSDSSDSGNAGNSNQPSNPRLNNSDEPGASSPYAVARRRRQRKALEAAGNGAGINGGSIDNSNGGRNFSQINISPTQGAPDGSNFANGDGGAANFRERSRKAPSFSAAPIAPPSGSESGGGLSSRAVPKAPTSRGGQGGVFGKTLDLTPLALNEDQKNRVRQLRTQTRLKVKDLRKSVLQSQSELRRLMFDPDASDDQIRSARSQLRKLQDQMDETNMNDLLAVRNMLTPDQKRRLPDCMPGRNKDASKNVSYTNQQNSVTSPDSNQPPLARSR